MDSIQGRLTEIREIADAGFAMALHIRFTTPAFLFQSYPEGWRDYYSKNGLVMHDPTVRWGFENSGSVAWSELGKIDPANVLAAARDHGMAYGMTYATQSNDSHTVSSFASGTHDFGDTERAKLIELVEGIHIETRDLDGISPDTVQALKKLSITTTLG